MLTRQIWRAFKHPLTPNPLFQRARMAVLVPPPTCWQRALQWFMLVAILIGLAFLIYSTSLASVVSFLLFGVLIWVFFNATAYGILWAQNIALFIVRQQEAHIYDFFCVTPAGEPGVCWLTSTGLLHHRMRRFNLKLVNRLNYFLIAYVGVAAIGINLYTWLDAYIRIEPFPALHLYMFLMTVAVVLYFHSDFIQSVILGSLVGMIASTFVHNSAHARPTAGITFMTIQFSSYLLVWFGWLTFLPWLTHLLGLTGWGGEVIVTFLRVGLFYAIRELTIYGLWRLLARRLAVQPARLFAALTSA